MVIKCKPIWTSAELYFWTLLFNVFSYGSKQSKDTLKVHWTLTTTTKRNMYLQFSVENFWICQCLGTTGETILHLFSIHIHVFSLGQILCHHHSPFGNVCMTLNQKLPVIFCRFHLLSLFLHRLLTKEFLFTSFFWRALYL